MDAYSGETCKSSGILSDSKESPRQYRIAKDFTPMDFYEFIKSERRSDCQEFKDDFEALGGSYTPYCLFKVRDRSLPTLWGMVASRSYFREYLLKGGFIEEIKEEVFYKGGDRFKCDQGEIWMLCIIYSKAGYKQAGLVSVETKERPGHSYRELTSIKDPCRITEDEFKEMQGIGFRNFTKI